MKTFASEQHRLHFPRVELDGGEFVRPYECPERWDMVVAALAEQDFPNPIEPNSVPFERLAAIHSRDYLGFLSGAWEEWVAAGEAGEAIANMFPVRRMSQRVPNCIAGKLGYYAQASETAITAGTWPAALSSAACAYSAAEAVASGEPAAFALCRPPGHHAATDLFGGYCFINNAALAAQTLLDRGAKRVAILDVDFHHGNGTQDIFWQREDVFFASLHGDPLEAFPFFTGHMEEVGEGSGEGATLNLPLPRATSWLVWSAALQRAIKAIVAHGVDALVVSLGVDTYMHDPISFFHLDSDDFMRCGAMISAVGLPTVFAMEGGYAVEQAGRNTVNVLRGFEQR